MLDSLSEVDLTIVESSKSTYYCIPCCLDFGEFGGVSQVRAHVKSKKHRRCVTRQMTGLISKPFDTAMLSAGVERILVLGDCHGGRSLTYFSGLTRARFYGGSAFSWANGTRHIPPLEVVLGRDLKRLQGRSLVVVFSYGEIDIRCHHIKWRDSVMSLAKSYVQKVQAYVKCFNETSVGKSVKVIPVLLSVPPPSDQGYNPKAPFVGKLSERVIATKRFNQAIKLTCNELKCLTTTKLSPEFNPSSVIVACTDENMWDFAAISDAAESGRTCKANESNVPGSLNPELGDGHVHVRSEMCSPMHEHLRQIMSGLVSLKHTETES